MGLFKNLMNKIFHATAYAERAPDARPNPPAATATPAGGAQPAAQGPVDVAAVLDQMAAAHHEKLDWRHSIVDLMKLVGMDSSLAERKELAADLKYTGDTNDSATMNMWLHKEVMRKLAENGGKVPAELLAHEAART